MRYEVYAIENSLTSLTTRVRFRVWEQKLSIEFLKDDCIVVLDGRYDIDSEGLDEEIEAIYNEEMVNA
jgi:hypothetical protein